jgi:dienelactone hydrolase
VAVVVGVVGLAGGGGGHPGTTTTPPRSTTGSTTSAQPGTVGLGLRTVTWTDNNPSAGYVVNPAPGGSAHLRKLVTEVWYPSVGGSSTTPSRGAKPDYAAGPFPVVVFAHGFDTVPATYAPLLRSWVSAGFVVVAPLFPDENANEISSLGNATTTELEVAESDVVNEPYDIAYVVGQVESGAAGSASSGVGWLKGLVAPGKYALAGHSDGAQAVAALVYSQETGQAYATTFADLATRPFAVVILSGSELSGTYAAPASPPPMLLVQSAVDQCNLPQNAGTLLHDAGGGFYLDLLGAHHFSPYVGLGQSAPVVESLTSAFLKAAATGTPTLSALSPSVTSARIAVLYGPAKAPVIAAVPTPTPAERVAACAIPTT